MLVKNITLADNRIITRWQLNNTETKTGQVNDCIGNGLRGN
jgi:hypothetical protein